MHPEQGTNIGGKLVWKAQRKMANDLEKIDARIDLTPQI